MLQFIPDLTSLIGLRGTQSPQRDRIEDALFKLGSELDGVVVGKEDGLELISVGDKVLKARSENELPNGSFVKFRVIDTSPPIKIKLLSVLSKGEPNLNITPHIKSLIELKSDSWQLNRSLSPIINIELPDISTLSKSANISPNELKLLDLLSLLKTLSIPEDSANTDIFRVLQSLYDTSKKGGEVPLKDLLRNSLNEITDFIQQKPSVLAKEFNHQKFDALKNVIDNIISEAESLYSQKNFTYNKLDVIRNYHHLDSVLNEIKNQVREIYNNIKNDTENLNLNNQFNNSDFIASDNDSINTNDLFNNYDSIKNSGKAVINDDLDIINNTNTEKILQDNNFPKNSITKELNINNKNSQINNNADSTINELANKNINQKENLNVNSNNSNNDNVVNLIDNKSSNNKKSIIQENDLIQNKNILQENKLSGNKGEVADNFNNNIPSAEKSTNTEKSINTEQKQNNIGLNSIKTAEIPENNVEAKINKENILIKSETQNANTMNAISNNNEKSNLFANQIKIQQDLNETTKNDISNNTENSPENVILSNKQQNNNIEDGNNLINKSMLDKAIDKNINENKSRISVNTIDNLENLGIDKSGKSISNQQENTVDPLNQKNPQINKATIEKASFDEISSNLIRHTTFNEKTVMDIIDGFKALIKQADSLTSYQNYIRQEFDISIYSFPFWFKDGGNGTLTWWREQGKGKKPDPDAPYNLFFDLNMEDLGQIKIYIQKKNQSIDISIAALKDSISILRKNLPTLRERLNSSGITINNINTFSLFDEAPPDLKGTPFEPLNKKGYLSIVT